MKKIHPLQMRHSSPAGGKIRVLIIDDEKVIRDLLQLSMQRMGYVVVTAENGLEATRIFHEHRFDIVLLDVVMPELDGFQTCTELRKVSNVPIVLLTALSRTDDVVLGLEAGADTYITKPFTFREVEAQVRAILRRAANKWKTSRTPVLEQGDVKLEDDLRTATVDGSRVELTHNQYQMLYQLMSHADRPLSKDHLLQNVWGYDSSEINSNVVELAVARLRKKLENDSSKPCRLITIRGVGYQFCPQNVVQSPTEPGSASALHRRRLLLEHWLTSMSEAAETGRNGSVMRTVEARKAR